MERTFDWGTGDAAKTYYLRAVARDWTTTEQIMTGSDGANEMLSLPPPMHDGAYLGDKRVPGILSHFKVPAHGEAGSAGFVGSEFKGLLLGWDEKDHFVRPLSAAELQAYDTACPALEVYDVHSSIRIPHACLLHVGEPEVQVFPTLPFGVYAAFSVPVGFSRIQVLFDGAQLDVVKQRSLLPDRLFSELSGSKESVAAAAAGLVLSRVSLRVDGVRVSVLVPLCQLEQ